MTQMFREVTECRCCLNTELVDVIDLTDQPSANSYWANGETQPPKFPLKTVRCTKCFHVQLSVVVDPEYLFKNYAYVSGTTTTLADYFKWFAGFVDSVLKSQDSVRTNRILDIASNDGSQLKPFKELKYDVQGVDPAENIVPMAEAAGIPTICDFWSSSLAKTIGLRYDAIIAQNVFAHVHDVYDFLLGVKEVMHDRSVAFIQTSQANMFERNEFDTIYHEHLSFFNTKSMNAVCERAGLKLSGVIKTNIHGTSYVFMITKTDLFTYSNLEDTLQNEQNRGLYDSALYTRFAQNAKKVVTDLKNAIEKYREDGYYTIGYGAAAKGMTVLNFGNIKLDFVIDENPLKQMKFTPGSNIPIYAKEALGNVPISTIVFVPLAWNFYDEIHKKIKSLRPDSDDVFIRYFPQLEILK